MNPLFMCVLGGGGIRFKGRLFHFSKNSSIMQSKSQVIPSEMNS